MVLGLILVAVAAVWFSTRPSLSTKARMLHTQISESHEKTPEQSHSVIKLPNASPPEINSDTDFEQDNTSGFIVKKEFQKIKTKYHVVAKGETLYDISSKYYGSGNRWQKIFNENKNLIKDANKLMPGTRLLIPE